MYIYRTILPLKYSFLYKNESNMLNNDFSLPLEPDVFKEKSH